MINITLRGILASKFGDKWNLDVSSVQEIFQAIKVNTKNSEKIFYEAEKLFSHFMVVVDGSVLPSYLFFSDVLEPGNNVEIVPIVQGGGATLFFIGLGLMILSYFLMKWLSPKAPKDIKTSSTILQGMRNVTARNVVVPIGYGRLRVGSVVITNDIVVKPYRIKAVTESDTTLKYLDLIEQDYNFKDETVYEYYAYNPFVMN